MSPASDGLAMVGSRAASLERAPVALLSNSMLGGGAERVMAILANEFAARGLPVDLLLIHATGEYLAQLSPSVNLVELRASRIATSVLPIASYLRQAQPRSLLATLTSVNLIALLAHRLARSRARLVLREANTLSVTARNARGSKERLLPQLARHGYPRADRIVAVSRGVAQDLHASWGIPRSKITVIYNPLVGPDLQILASSPAPHPWLEDPTHPLVLGVGRLSRQKNFPLLLQAFARLRKHTPARLIILGEGEDRDELSVLSGELGIQDAVAMPGFADNPFAFMARAAVFVLSSSWEGLPGVLIQALACGCPVVSTDCPHGPREILDNGRIGRLVAMDDPEALCEAMLAAIRGSLQPADPGWLAQFSPGHIVEQYRQVLMEDDDLPVDTRFPDA